MPSDRGIPQQVIEEIKARCDIVQLVSQYVSLSRKSAANLFGLCPFHSEKTPSFSVSSDKQIYYCFGCHKGGDVIGFLMEIEKIGYLDAIRMLAERTGVKIPEPDDEQYRRRTELTNQLYRVNASAAAYFYRNLTESPKGKSARTYLEKRDIRSGTIKRFGMGYSLHEWSDLWKHLLDKGFSKAILDKCGLFRQGREGPYDLFRDRIMFPIFDVMGRVVAFGGRIMDDSQPKYINSPESPVYTKGRHLYGLNFAKKSRADSLVIVEGYMDAIAMHQAGVDNAVAALGTALTANQARLARRYSEKVVIGFDADASGQEATLRSLDILEAKDCKVSVLQIPDGKDPDEYIKRNGSDRFRDLLKRALPLMDYKLYSAERQSTSDSVLDPLAYQEVACKYLAAESNQIIRELYAAKVADKLGVPSDAVVQEVERRRKGAEAASAKNTLRERISVHKEQETLQVFPPFPEHAVYLLCLLATRPGLTDGMRQQPEPEDFPEGVLRDMASVLFSSETADIGVSGLIRMAGDEMWGDRRIADEMAGTAFGMGESGDMATWTDAADSYLSRIREDRLKRKKEEIVARRSRETDTANRSRLGEELLDIDRQLRLLKG